MKEQMPANGISPTIKLKNKQTNKRIKQWANLNEYNPFVDDVVPFVTVVVSVLDPLPVHNSCIFGIPVHR